MRLGDFKFKVFLLYSILSVAPVFGNYGDPYASLKVWTGVSFTGESLIVTGLSKIGDCAELWSNPAFASFNDRAGSVELAPGVCVRLFEHACSSGPSGGRTYDLYPWSPIGANLNFANFAGILSGIGLIACETIIYDGPSGAGVPLSILDLKTVGTCVDIWSNPKYLVFNDRIRSLQLSPRACVRVYKDGCGSAGSLDITPNSPLANDPGAGFRDSISAIELINCPTPKGIILFSDNYLLGDSLTLPDMYNVGDLIALFDLKLIPWFDDRLNSIYLPPGVCVKLHENVPWNPPGAVLETCSTSTWRVNLSSASFANKTSAIELTAF